MVKTTDMTYDGDRQGRIRIPEEYRREGRNRCGREDWGGAGGGGRLVYDGDNGGDIRLQRGEDGDDVMDTSVEAMTTEVVKMTRGWGRATEVYSNDCSNVEIGES